MIWKRSGHPQTSCPHVSRQGVQTSPDKLSRRLQPSFPEDQACREKLSRHLHTSCPNVSRQALQTSPDKLSSRLERNCPNKKKPQKKPLPLSLLLPYPSFSLLSPLLPLSSSAPFLLPSRPHSTRSPKLSPSPPLPSHPPPPTYPPTSPILHTPLLSIHR